MVSLYWKHLFKIDFGLQAVQNDSNLANWDGGPSYNVLAWTSNKNFSKTQPTTQRLSVIVPDSNSETSWSL